MYFDITSMFNSYYLAALAFLLPFAAIIGSIMITSGKSQFQNTARYNILIHNALPDLPEYKVFQHKGRGLIFSIILVVTSLLNPFFGPLFSQIAPTMPGLLNRLLGTMLWVTILVTGKRIVDRWGHPDHIFITAYAYEMMTSLSVALGALGLVEVVAIVEIGQTHIYKNVLNGSITSFFIAVIVGLPFALIWALTHRYYQISSLIKSGLLTRALYQIEVLQRSRPYSTMLIALRGTVEGMLDHFQDAEDSFRQALAISIQSRSSSKSHLTGILNGLASTPMEEKRYEDAERLVNLGLEIDPRNGALLRDKAEIYLEQGNAEYALGMLKMALPYYKAKKDKLDKAKKSQIVSDERLSTDRYGWSMLLADYAWALTLINQPEQAANLIKRALKETDHTYTIGQASLHYRIGCVEVLRHNRTLAEEHFQRALELGKDTYIARKASEALHEL